MTAPARLALYGAALAAIFVVAFLGGRAFIPDSAAAARTEAAAEEAHGGGHGENSGAAHAVPGLAVEQDGYRIHDVTVPAAGQAGTLSFRLSGPDGAPVTDYTTEHDKDLHLIVVRSDGAEFRHVHPTNNGDGSWSLPWRWNSAGTYRLFTDFVPTDLGSKVVLTSTVSVAGDSAPQVVPPDSTVAQADEFTVTLDGHLGVGADEPLRFTVSRNGTPVTDLQPYLGAYGHLVALREGDLGYLHVHPVGEPNDGTTRPGPDIEFMAEPPTPGKYFLYLDFQVDGRVHTARFTATAHSDH